MKNVLKMGIISVVALSMSTAAPAYAGKDGESGYALGCLVGWLFFGLSETCQEL